MVQHWRLHPLHARDTMIMPTRPDEGARYNDTSQTEGRGADAPPPPPPLLGSANKISILFTAQRSAAAPIQRGAWWALRSLARCRRAAGGGLNKTGDFVYLPNRRQAAATAKPCGGRGRLCAGVGVWPPTGALLPAAAYIRGVVAACAAVGVCPAESAARGHRGSSRGILAHPRAGGHSSNKCSGLTKCEICARV